MSNYTFASMPSVSIARSKFHRTQPHNTSFNLGELVVLGFDEVIPGSTHKIELGSLVRMSTPIAPIMDDIQMDVYSFFVPMRLTWEHWKQFMGESDQAGIATVAYTIPSIGHNCYGSVVNSIADDLGIFPRETNYSSAYIAGNTTFSVLPFRAIALIYNRWFRNQNVEAPIAVDIGDNVTATNLTALNPGLVIPDFNANGPVGSGRFKAYKLPDYFTSALPYAQKGDPVKIFGENAMAPVVTGAVHTGSGVEAKFYAANGNLMTGDRSLNVISTGAGRAATVSTVSGASDFAPSNYWANLSLAVNSTINDLRFAFQLQKALEKDALYGSRYWEVLRAHYAVTSPDATLQDPELLGHIKFDINISQVLQTTGFISPSSTNLGTPGANSVTANKGHLFTASFVEHGYIIHIAVARQKRHTYSQGFNRLWSRSTRFDFYHPVFANIGAQKVLEKELCVWNNTQTIQNDDVFGYQEAWAEYRFLPGYNSGLMNPARPNSLDYWTLADTYSSQPTLSKSFLQESRGNLARALVTGVAGPDFIGSFYFKDTVVNPMPLYSIPGFADHH